MIKVGLAADPGVQKAIGATAAASFAGAWWATAKDVALEIFGVPLPVVLACATASAGALSFVSGMTYLRTLVSWVVWSGIGTWGAQFVLWIIAHYMGVEVPGGVLTGAGIVVAGGGPLVMTRENVQKLREAVGRVIDGFAKGGQA